MKKRPIYFKCPYNEFSCEYVNTSNATLDQDCNTCKHYHNGVKATGSLPVLNSIYQFIKKNKLNVELKNRIQWGLLWFFVAVLLCNLILAIIS